MRRSIKQFLADDAAATAIEYGLITSLVAIAIIAAITALGSGIEHTFNEVSGNLK